MHRLYRHAEQNTSNLDSYRYNEMLTGVVIHSKTLMIIDQIKFPHYLCNQNTTLIYKNCIKDWKCRAVISILTPWLLAEPSDAVPHYAVFTYFGIKIRKDLITKATAIFTSRLRVGQESVNILYSIKIAFDAYILKA